MRTWHPCSSPDSARRTSGNARRGLTLIELAMVLAIVGMVVGFATPYAHSAQLQSDAAARKLLVTLMAAERLAVARQHDVVVSFDVAGHTIRTLEDRNSNGRVDLGERVVWQPLGDNAYFVTPPSGLTGSAPAPVVGGKLTQVDSMASVVFRRNGAASTDAEVYVGAGAVGRWFYRAVAVTQATGRPAWYRWLGDRWKDGSL